MATLVMSCTREEEPIGCMCESDQPEITDLEVSWVSGTLGGDWAKLGWADPVSGMFWIRMENITELRACGLSIPSASIRLSESDSLLGDIPLEWSGEVGCYSADTVFFRKNPVASGERTIDLNNCGEMVYLQLVFVDSRNDSLLVESEPLQFGCSF